MRGKLKLTDAMKEYKKEFKHGGLNIINAPAGSGKTTFILGEFLKNTSRYVENLNNDSINYIRRLSNVLYVCDNTMLKDSVIANNDVTGIFEKGSLLEAKNSTMLKNIIKNDSGTIKVITYSKLGLLLKNPACKHIILNHFCCIIMDEVHNLFKYCRKYNYDKNTKSFTEDGEYVEVLDNLNEIAEKVLLIGLSATPYYIYTFKRFANYELKTREIFNYYELKNLDSKNFNPIYSNCIFNQIKTLNYKKIKEHGFKIYINTSKIEMSKKYKRWFEMNGLKAEWLCSINNKKEIITIDSNGKEKKEKVSQMNDEQKQLRERLIKGTKENNYKDKGILPDYLDVIIVNGGYETGWDLFDERVQFCFIDNTDEDYQYQARNRIRHDILYLTCLCTTYDGDGIVLEKGKYGEKFEKEIEVSKGVYRKVFINVPKMKEIDDKYIGYKLTKEMKEEIVQKYGIKNIDNKLNFKSVTRDLIELGYKVETYKGKNGGTYIFKKGEEMKKDNIREVAKMDNKNSNINLVCNWLEKEWDKVIIPVNEVRDILDIGRKSWDNIMKDNEFNIFLKDNRIKMNVVKGRGRTLYFKKY